MVQLPDGASVARTSEVTKRVEDILKGIPAVDHTMSIIGYSLLDGGNLPNAAFLVVRLKPFEDRTTAAASAQALIRKVFSEGSKISEAMEAVPGDWSSCFTALRACCEGTSTRKHADCASAELSVRHCSISIETSYRPIR